MLEESFRIGPAHRSADREHHLTGGRIARGNCRIAVRRTKVSRGGEHGPTRSELRLIQRFDRADEVGIAGLVSAEALGDNGVRVLRQGLALYLCDVKAVVGVRDGEDDVRPGGHRVRILDVERRLDFPRERRTRADCARGRLLVVDREARRRRDPEPCVE